MKRVIVVAVALTLTMSAVALAGNNPGLKVAIHVRAHNAKAGCTITPAISSCEGIVTTDPGFSIDAFPVFYDLNEYLGCEYAVCWPAWTYSAAWNNCADLVIGSITQSGQGASHTWLGCQPGPVAVPSFLWLYADFAGMICPCPHPISGLYSVLDCAEGIDNPITIFCAGVYGAIGDDPCLPDAVTPKTWGGIKSIFK